jgi:tetratricopeptide (TPR) repeat protein
MSFAKHAPPGSDRRKKNLGLHTTERRRSRTHGGRVVTGIVSVFLAVIVWIAFGQALRHEFVGYDDHRYVLQNPRVTNGLTLGGIQWAFTHVHASNWHPLTTISHMLDCQLYGLQPWGHHLTNILLQAAAAVLLFLALRNLTGDPWPSLFVAAIFAVHPLRVESVAWVSERKDVLSGVFFMLVLWAYARYARGNARSSFWYITVAVLFALGLMCKPTLVTLPFVLLLLDYWPLGRTQRSSSGARGITASKWQQRRDTWPRLVIEKLPLFVLSAASCAATVVAQKQALDLSLKPPLAERVGNALVSYAMYLGQMIWPSRLAVLYPYPEGNLKVPQVILALLLLLIISAAFFLWRRKYPFLLIGWLWYLGMLVPMIGIVQVGSQVRADRYTYLPQIGLYLLVAWGATELFHRWRRTREILAITAVLIIMALTTRSYLQTSYWRDTETLWKHAIASTSNNYIAHTNLAETLSQSGRFAEAIAECEKALKIKPDLAAAHNNLGSALQQNTQSGDGARGQDGAVDEAIEHFRKALQIKPDFTQARSNLGNTLLQKGQVDEAIAQFQKTLEMEPNYAEGEFSLGNAFLQKREVNEAIAHYQKALEINPDYAKAQYYLGNAFVAEGQYSQSIAAYEAAVRIRPDYFEAHRNMGRVLATIGKTNEALKEFDEALRINGNSAEVHFTLGSLLRQMGHREEAIAHLAEALRLKPDYEYAKQQLRELGVPVPQ